MSTVKANGLSAEQRRRFEDRGLVRLEGLIPRRTAEEMAERLWQELARQHGIRRREPSTWRTERPAQFGAVQKAGAFKGLATPEFRAVLDDLLGHDRWAQPPSWGQPLVCFPRAAGHWDVPHQSWHLDLPADPKRHSAMVARLFAVLAPLGPKGGGTLVATGSHRIVATLADRRGVQLSSSEMRKRLKLEHRWFGDLMSPARDREDRHDRFMRAATVVNGVPLQVEEMTGEPGDVFLMHPVALHAGAPNVLEAPRLVLAQTVYPKSWFGV